MENRFASGNKILISALSRIKSYLDYGAFTPIQVAAATALNSSQDHVSHIRKVYKNRRDVLIESMKRVGWIFLTHKLQCLLGLLFQKST